MKTTILETTRWEEIQAYLVQALNDNRPFGANIHVKEVAKGIAYKMSTARRIRENLESVDAARQALVDKFEGEIAALEQQVRDIRKGCKHPASELRTVTSTVCLICGEITNV